MGLGCPIACLSEPKALTPSSHTLAGQWRGVSTDKNPEAGASAELGCERRLIPRRLHHWLSACSLPGRHSRPHPSCQGCPGRSKHLAGPSLMGRGPGDPPVLELWGAPVLPAELAGCQLGHPADVALCSSHLAGPFLAENPQRMGVPGGPQCLAAALGWACPRTSGAQGLQRRGGRPGLGSVRVGLRVASDAAGPQMPSTAPSGAVPDL